MTETTSERKLNNETLTKEVIKLMKNDISVRYKETGELTDEDWEFCEQIDWHPWLELSHLNKQYYLRWCNWRMFNPNANVPV